MALTSQGTRSSRSRPDQYRFAGPGWIKDLAAGRIAMSWLNAREGMTVNSEKVQADAHELWQTGAGWPTIRAWTPLGRANDFAFSACSRGVFPKLEFFSTPHH
jgi:hypothetical protein